jgi:hypothetical protein
MRKTAVCIAQIATILLFSATLLHAAEQKIIFNTERIEYESGTGAKQCQAKCSRRSGPDAASLLSAGWKIVSSSPKEEVAENYWYTPCNTCSPHGCTCFGTEYILQRDAPAPRVESTIYEPDSRDNYNRSGFTPQETEASNSELELLKKKNELLIKEISSLKQENEKLKNQLRSRQR